MSRRTKELLKENNEYEQQLSEQGKEILTDIVVYLRGISITMYEQEKVRQDITQMLIEGEQRGNTAAEVIGEDYREFCDNIVNEIPQMTQKEKILTGIRDIMPAVTVLLVIWCFGRFVRIVFGISHSFTVPVTTGNIVGAAMIVAAAEILILFLSKHAFRENRSDNVKWCVLLVVFLVTAVCINELMTRVLFSIHLGTAVLLALAVFMLYRILDEKLD